MVNKVLLSCSNFEFLEKYLLFMSGVDSKFFCFGETFTDVKTQLILNDLGVDFKVLRKDKKEVYSLSLHAVEDFNDTDIYNYILFATAHDDFSCDLINKVVKFLYQKSKNIKNKAVSTYYVRSGKLYSSYINSPYHVDSYLKNRGLNEVVGHSLTSLKLSKIESTHKSFKKKNYIDCIHTLAFAGALLKNINLLYDDGLIHEVIHWMDNAYVEGESSLNLENELKSFDYLMEMYLGF